MTFVNLRDDKGCGGGGGKAGNLTYTAIPFGFLVDCKTARIFAYSSTGEQSNKRSGTRLKT